MHFCVFGDSNKLHIYGIAVCGYKNKSDPRNESLMKMFNLIDIGEHAGSGVHNIFNVWEDEGWEEPDIKEDFDPDRTSLTLRFIKKQAIKTRNNQEAFPCGACQGSRMTLLAEKAILNGKKLALFCSI